jgi:CRP-like cAMP-binding protein
MYQASQYPGPSSSRSGRASPDLTPLIERIAPSSAAATRRALVDRARIRPFVPEEVVLTQGERSSVGLVMDGVVAARRRTPDGRTVVPLILRSGELLGPVVLAGQEALFDFVGLVPGSAALWSSSLVRSLAASDAGLALGLLDRALHRLGELTARLDSLHYQDARKRVARVLIEHRDLCFGERPDIARTELSMFIGTSREMTRRVMSRLVRDGAVRRVGLTGLELRDEDKLRALAGLGPVFRVS